MRSFKLSHLRVGLLLPLVAGLLASTPLPVANAAAPAASSGQDFGIVCENAGQTDPTHVDLTAKDGYISIPDGNTIYMWGYGIDRGDGNGATYQNPGPTLCFTEGQSVTITLHNTLPEAVSVMFPGQHAVQSSGATAPNSFVAAAAATNGTATYTFTADHPGTFIYESGTSMQKQVQMGLFGAIIVRPAMGDNFVYNWVLTQFNTHNYRNDYMMLLSEIDPDWHTAVEHGDPYNPTDYHPRYWQINGRSFPDTVAPNYAAWLPSQPYGALLHILPSASSVVLGSDGLRVKSGDTSNSGDPDKYQQNSSVVRIMNVGVLNHPVHPHGNHVQIIGRDGHPLVTAATNLTDANVDDHGLSYSKFDIMTGSGQVWDVLYDWTNKDNYNRSDNQVPYQLDSGDNGQIFNPQAQAIIWKLPNFFSGSPYLGETGNKNDAVDTSYNQCGEYYQIWHSHALIEAANYEAGFGGMITLERIDPPGHFNCQ